MAGKLSASREPRPWVKSLYLDRDLYFGMLEAALKLQISERFALLLATTEGLHALGVLPEEAYNRLRTKYSQPLREMIDQNRAGTPTQTTPETREAPMAEKKLEGINLRTLGQKAKQIIKQWPHLDRDRKTVWRNIALKNPMMPGSREILNLWNQDQQTR